jgi:predicted pyridoxine 5'-phosphate oxidase superfamily flavin-nucleotide-binding protein
MTIDDERPFTEDMKRIVAEQRLAFVATVCPDGTPNLSPKGTIAVWDATHLVFADIRSPGTVANLKVNPTIEINVVDPYRKKGVSLQRHRRTGHGWRSFSKDARFLSYSSG